MAPPRSSSSSSVLSLSTLPLCGTTSCLAAVLVGAHFKVAHTPRCPLASYVIYVQLSTVLSWRYFNNLSCKIRDERERAACAYSALPDVLLCFLLFCWRSAKPRCADWAEKCKNILSMLTMAPTQSAFGKRLQQCKHTHTHTLYMCVCVCVCEDVFSQSETATKCIYVQYTHTRTHTCSMHAEQDSASCLRCYCVPHILYTILEEEMETRLCTDSILIWFSWLTFGQTGRQTTSQRRICASDTDSNAVLRLTDWHRTEIAQVAYTSRWWNQE